MLTVEVFGVGKSTAVRETLIPLIQRQMDAIGAHKTVEDIKKALLNAMKPESSAVLFVGSVQDLPIAFAFGNLGTGLASGGQYFWLNEIHVDAAYRGLGYGALLLNGVESWLKERRIFTMAGVTGLDNKPAQGLFKNQGFEQEALIWVEKTIKE